MYSDELTVYIQDGFEDLEQQTGAIPLFPELGWLSPGPAEVPQEAVE